MVDLSFSAPPISAYLEEFYRPYPLCDFEPLSGANYRLVSCKQCGCLFQNPVPSDNFLAKFYGEGLYGSPHKKSPSAEPYLVEQMTRELMMVVRYLQPRASRPIVLDFGAGNGQWAKLASAAGLDTHASDLSEHAYPLLGSWGIVCHRQDKLPTSSFDFINTEQVFEHLPRPTEVLVRLVEALRPGGVLKIGVPHDPQIRRKLTQPDWLAPKNSPGSLNAVAPVEHLNYFESASLLAFCQRAGLLPMTVSGWGLFCSEAESQPRRLRARLASWLRHRLGDFHSPHFALTQTVFFRKSEHP